MRDDRDADGRDHDEPDREQSDRPGVGAEVAEGREEGGSVEERRQHAEQHQLRLELELGQPREEPEHEPAEHEQDRVGDPQRGRAREEGGDDRQQAEGDEALGEIQVHRRILPTRCAGKR